MEKYEMTKRKDFLRVVGVERDDFINILLEVECCIENQSVENPLTKRGRKSSISLPDKVLLSFFIYVIIQLLLN
jgi:hypothetical protein